MSNITRATLGLSNEAIAYNLHAYDYVPGPDRVGLQAARALDLDPSLVLKTLMMKANRKPVCVVVPANREVQLKSLAAFLGVKAVEMMKPVEAERVTGYRVGGISPFGQRQPATSVVEADVLGWSKVYINAGQRGLLLSISPADAVRFLGSRTAQISV